MIRLTNFILAAIIAVLCTACVGESKYVPDPVGSYARGADCSWLTEQERDGVLFADSLGNPKECMRLMRDCGLNAVRLRVWVNHATGWCNLEDVLVKARRVHQLRLRLMIDIHYSDYFADPATQTTPAAWQDYDMAQLRQAVADHTAEVLNALNAEGITPEWIQIGNETRNGMLWPSGKLWDTEGAIDGGWERYASLERAGYDAAKAVFPNANIIVHIDNAYQDNTWFFRALIENGGRFDMIGLSHYPMMAEWSHKTWQEMNSLAIANMIRLHEEFGCPVMMAEIGTLGEPAKEQEALQVVTDLLAQAKQQPWFAGTFYWEPQVFANWRPQEYEAVGWGAYGMGAFKTVKCPSDSLHLYGTPNDAFLYLVRR